MKNPLPPANLRLALKRFISGLALGLVCLRPEVLPGQVAGGDHSPFEIRSVTANDKAVSLRRNGEVNLGSSPNNILFAFGPRADAQPAPVRIRYKLEGYDNNWRDGASDASARS